MAGRSSFARSGRFSCDVVVVAFEGAFEGAMMWVIKAAIFSWTAICCLCISSIIWKASPVVGDCGGGTSSGISPWYIMVVSPRKRYFKTSVVVWSTKETSPLVTEREECGSTRRVLYAITVFFLRMCFFFLWIVWMFVVEFFLWAVLLSWESFEYCCVRFQKKTKRYGTLTSVRRTKCSQYRLTSMSLLQLLTPGIGWKDREIPLV